MADKLTPFDYLLNAFEQASQADHPAREKYGDKRRALYAHVRELERKAALFDAAAGVQEPRGISPAEAARITWQDRNDIASADELWQMVADSVLAAAGVQVPAASAADVSAPPQHDAQQDARSPLSQPQASSSPVAKRKPV